MRIRVLLDRTVAKTSFKRQKTATTFRLILAMASTAGSADATAADTMDSSQLYRVLDIPKQASQADIKRAYRALALRLHPDKASSFSSLSLALHVSFHSRIQ